MAIVSAAFLLLGASSVYAVSSASSVVAAASPQLAFVSSVNARQLDPPPSAPSLISNIHINEQTTFGYTNYQLSNNISQKHTQLYATIDDSDVLHELHQLKIIQRLELDQQFERWRFLQKLLEGEMPASDIEDVLLLSLSAYLNHGPTASSANNKNENGGNASPVLTDGQRTVMAEVIDAMVSVSDGIGDSRFLHMLVLPPVDYESVNIDVEDDTTPMEEKLAEIDPVAMSILERIEQLLPDPIEDEESYKSAWDVVIDLYGRESVRVREETLQREKEGGITVVAGGSSGSSGLKCNADNLQWRALCAVGRVLIHYDFLTKGVLKEGTFR